MEPYKKTVSAIHIPAQVHATFTTYYLFA